jgi:hypothetical protein
MKKTTMDKQILDENTGLWFTTFVALTEGGCPEYQAAAAADIVATDDYSIDMQGGRSEAEQELVKSTLKYLQGSDDA